MLPEAPMSPLTIFLAKPLGLYCIIVALAMRSGDNRRSSSERRSGVYFVVRVSDEH
jgi:hypothetical protein